jgi:AmpE protein
MKLLVIVLCLLSERFLVHVSSHHRFTWFQNYWGIIGERFAKNQSKIAPLVMLFLIVAPAVLVTWGMLYLFSNWLFGFVGLFLNVVVFYYCLGPGNPFYPTNRENAHLATNEVVGDYLAQVNGQLFSVIFWYIALGPAATLAYRLISFCQTQEIVRKEAGHLTALLDWIPAKITSLLYLLVGNFQAGFQHFSRFLFAAPQENNTMLSVCGLCAVGPSEQDELLLPQAEVLVEHAVIVLLVLLALFTMASWL